ncbi:uncharacterized protein LOC123317340 [Coccinella septempunctata]|uniref:uncharacterized protein LOC123317340 n=1 Tax=Coccinella septempunctata TaxID=41139 RepID=UPI001D0821A2|nr:uncharacterized protein LOC123317340 [Coccinella septempunctata]
MRDAASETRLLQQKLSNITSHPFVNFFLELCKSRDGLDLKDLAKKAGRLWQEMDVSEKVPYYRLARKVKKIGKSKKGLDVPRNKRRRIRPRRKPVISPAEHRKILTGKRAFSQDIKGVAGPSEEVKNGSGNGSSTDCNSVEKYCLDVLKRRQSHSSTYESD